MDARSPQHAKRSAARPIENARPETQYRISEGNTVLQKSDAADVDHVGAAFGRERHPSREHDEVARFDEAAL